MYCYELILVSLNADYTTISGVALPSRGYVEDETYTRDRSILTGFSGILWGQHASTKWLNCHPDAKWAVMRTERSHDIIMLDKWESFVKFRSGTVVCLSDYWDCQAHILQCLDTLGPSVSSQRKMTCM